MKMHTFSILAEIEKRRSHTKKNQSDISPTVTARRHAADGNRRQRRSTR